MATISELATRLREQVLEPMKSRLIGKDEIIELMGICLVAGENLFLLGPPGTAKSALVHELSARLNARSFDYLLTRFTEPSELFGPFDIRRLRDGDLVTNIEGMLPEAEFVFLDELLNANSAILNSLLMALNERVFRRGRETMALPVLMVVAASNRLPEDEALAALFDRFLLRVRCDNVEDEQLQSVLSAGWKRQATGVSEATGLGVDEIGQLQRGVSNIVLEGSTDAFTELVLRLRKAGFAISDRRAVKLQRVIASSAILSGRERTEVSDLWVLRYIWDTAAQQETLIGHVDSVIEKRKDSQGDQKPHPMAQQSGDADPESIAADLTRMEQLLGDATDHQRAVAEDQLALLSERIQWVSNLEARAQLLKRVDELSLRARAADPPA